MSKIRPEIAEEFVRKVKLAFPQTVMMTNAEALEYAIQWAINEKTRKK